MMNEQEEECIKPAIFWLSMESLTSAGLQSCCLTPSSRACARFSWGVGMAVQASAQRPSIIQFQHKFCGTDTFSQIFDGKSRPVSTAQGEPPQASNDSSSGVQCDQETIECCLDARGSVPCREIEPLSVTVCSTQVLQQSPSEEVHIQILPFVDEVHLAPSETAL